MNGFKYPKFSITNLLIIQSLIIVSYQFLSMSCDVVSKIKFDISKINQQGLIGQENGLRSLSYEFCMPAEDDKLAEVKAIAPTVHYSRSPGRIGCRSDQILSIVDTYNPQWLKTLLSIAQLPYVEKIEETFWE